MTTKEERKIVIPGELISSTSGALPGEGTEKRKDGIYAIRYGLSEESNNLVKIIPLSGVYEPRRGNVVIGTVEMLTFNGWVINIGAAENGFLSLMEVPRYVNKDALEEVMDIGDVVIAKIWNINKRGIDLSIKMKGFGKVEDGMIIKVNPQKVPRIIGKEGSMVKLIKDETGCDIAVGQNGFIWLQGKLIEDELFAKKAIEFVAEKSFMSGLTEELTKWFDKEKGK